MLGMQLPNDERRQQGASNDEPADDPWGRPANLVGADKPPDDPDQADAGQPQTDQVELGGWPARLVQAQQDEGHQDEPDGDVEPEDPVPRDPSDDRAPDQRSEGHSKPADAAPDPERQPTSVRWNSGGQDCQRQRHHDCAADPL